MYYSSEPLLDERKQKILKAVVREHVQSAEPVGSGALMLHYNLGVRAATIRNEMAELSELGYLKQPHTSAGRIPSDHGYRFFVDRLMGHAILPKREALAARETLATVANELDLAITQTCRLLAGITRCASVATPPSTQDTEVSFIGLSKVDSRKLLLVIALSDGRVEHRVHDPGEPISVADAERVSNMLASRFAGKTLDEIRSVTAQETLAQSQSAPERAYCDVLTTLRQVVESLAIPDGEVHVEGTRFILSQPEFKDISRLEGILAALEERRRLYQLLSKTMLGPDVTVIIGRENPYNDMQETSFVAARYRIGSRTAGTIGVIGPTRMDYRHAVAAVEAMAQSLSELLTLLSFG